MFYCLIFCDDNEAQLKVVSNTVLDYIEKTEDCEGKAVLCTGKEQLKNALLKEECENKIVFMDICMEDEYNGIKLGEQINRDFPEVLLVYVTGFPCYASDVYETQHCYFIVKEELEQRLPALFGKIIPAQLRRNREFLDLHKGFKIRHILQADILYLERDLHKTRIYLKDGEQEETTEKLTQLIERLNPYEFVRCHNSYIVNMRHIREISRKCITMVNGAVINVSRAYVPEVKKRFTLWGNQEF
ncbi:MAG: LytTR family DNA-binding domain-containing protein [Eubacteriales bacterium]|nr:LytTR family DNA-binding domain-containing protein [Eubacteriales bacterium]